MRGGDRDRPVPELLWAGLLSALRRGLPQPSKEDRPQQEGEEVGGKVRRLGKEVRGKVRRLGPLTAGR